MIILDTDVVSELLRVRPDPRVRAWTEAQPSASLFTSAVTSAELRFGLAVLPHGQRRQTLEIVISASYGTFTHAIKGNVDILIALVMHTGAVIGAQIGVVATQYFAGPKIRLAFVPLPLIGAAIVIYTLVTGHKL